VRSGSVPGVPTGDRRAGNLYALELADLGRGSPSMAIVYGFWPRWEPRPAEDVIDADLVDFCLWFAETAVGLEREDVERVLERARPMARSARGSSDRPA